MERDEIELELTSGMSKVIHSQLNKDGSVNHDDIFGQMVAPELKTYSEYIKFRVKHEINNVVFNFKEQEFQSCSLSSISSSASANQEYIQLPSSSSAPVNQAQQIQVGPVFSKIGKACALLLYIYIYIYILYTYYIYLIYIYVSFVFKYFVSTKISVQVVKAINKDLCLTNVI